jgi:hypothetical protein
LKNFGQSAIATTLFSNNILLAATSNYWAAASEFKPLLHTWSLGVEEQYYIVYPLLLWACWTFMKGRVALIVGSLSVLSFATLLWCSLRHPTASFYILPTRAWEIFAGSFAAIYHIQHTAPSRNAWKDEILSALGALVVLASVFFVFPGVWTVQCNVLAAVAGTVLIVLFASEATIIGKILGNKVIVGIGLLSYSFYLWHQPFFAFARIYAKNPPTGWIYAILIVAALLTSYLSWMVIERPFRNRTVTTRRTIVLFSLGGSIMFISIGIYLNDSYGMLFRLYDPNVATISIMDKRLYNERVYRFEKDQFSDPHSVHVLVLGNSFGRDFVNMTTETFDTKSIEIVYRHDFGQCIVPFKSPIEEALHTQSEIVVFASWDPASKCIRNDDRFLEQNNKEYFYIGSKTFGYNLNWIGRLKGTDRANQYNRLPQEALTQESEMAAAVPAGHYISLLAGIVKGGGIPITDEKGYLISTDRAHITKFGAIFFGKRVLVNSRYGEMLERVSNVGSRSR